MKKQLSFIIIVVFIYHCIFPVIQAYAEPGLSDEKTIIMASVRKENSRDGILIKLFFTETFKRIGKELVIKYYPGKRATFMANRGEVDGEFVRVYKYNENNPNLIRVEEPALSARFTAFTTNPDIKLKGWESLKHTAYSVESMRGVKICFANLVKVVEKERLSQVDHWSQGLRKLIAGRTDVYVGVERTVLNALEIDEFKKSDIQIAGVMEEITLHAFLNIKHKHLEPQLSAVLKAMKEEGLMEKYDKIAGELKIKLNSR